MTGLLDALLAILIAVFVNVLILQQVQSRAPAADAPFLRGVYIATVLLRSVLAILLNIFATDSAFAAAFWGDSDTYDGFGYQLALRWSGDPNTNISMSTAASGYGWVYYVAFLYFMVGRNQLLVQLLNSVIGALTVLVIYSIASRLFDRAAARWAALFMAFFPQMVFWSTGMYKDPPILLCISVAMYAVLRLRERFSLSLVVQFVLAVVVLVTLRFYIAYFVLLAALGAFVFGKRGGATRTVITYGLMTGMLIGALNLAVKRETLERQTTYVSLERLQITRQDQATWGQSGFGQGYDVSTPGGALAALPSGLAYLLFAPFPWAVSGLRQALAVPETLVWYALMPAFARGLTLGLKKDFRAVLPIVLFAASLTLAYALMQGNVGTAYRQRTQVTMFFFIFMGVGIAEKRRRGAAYATAAGHSTLQESRAPDR